jgi:hypothetical protein
MPQSPFRFLNCDALGRNLKFYAVYCTLDLLLGPPPNSLLDVLSIRLENPLRANPRRVNWRLAREYQQIV